MQRFGFAFDYPLAAPLALAGITPATAHVDVDVQDGFFDIRFGPWRLRTPLDNIVGATITGPYKFWRVLGTHISLVDRGVSFGTNTEQGLCVTFREPVGGGLPRNAIRHPGATVTVRDCERLRAEVLRAAV